MSSVEEEKQVERPIDRNSQRINNVAEALCEILQAEKGGKRREAINHHGPYLLALATELNVGEGELASLLTAVSESGNSFLEVFARMAGHYKKQTRQMGFATRLTREEGEFDGVTDGNCQRTPTILYEEAEYSDYVQGVIVRMFGEGVNRREIFETEAVVIMAIMFVHGRNLQKTAKMLLALGESKDYAEAMDRLASNNGDLTLSPAVGRNGYVVKRLRGPLCINK